MRKGFLGSFAALVSGAGLALAQPTPAPQMPPASPPLAAGDVLVPAGSMPVGALPDLPSVSIPDDGPEGEAHKGAHGDRDKKKSAFNRDDHEIAYRFWARGEYLHIWFKDGTAPPPLGTTGPAPTFGILDRPGVTTVLGGKDTDYGALDGLRISGGMWFDKDAHLGLEATWFMLFENGVKSSSVSDGTGTPLLARPAINGITGESGVSLVAFPGALSGRIDVQETSKLWGVEANFIGSEWRGQWFWADVIAGFRFLDLDEELRISSSSTVMGGGTAAFLGQRLGPGNTITIRDRFHTENQFFGGQIGLRAEMHYERLFLNLQGKLAVGNNHQSVTIDGGSGLVGPAGRVQVPGGLLAVSSNSRVNSRDEFTLIPELIVNVGAYISNHAKVFVGYNYLYWSDVARPGNQASLAVNPAFVPTNLAFGTATAPRVPAAIINRSDFWAQGFNFGLEVRY